MSREEDGERREGGKDSMTSVQVQWSDEDGAYVASVPFMRGCKAHGSTEADAFENVKRAARLWLDAYFEFGYSVHAGLDGRATPKQGVSKPEQTSRGG